MSKSLYNNSITHILDTESFEGEWESCHEYKSIHLTCQTDVVSSVEVFFSRDKTNAVSHVFEIPADTFIHRTIPVEGFYFKVICENNSGTDQSSLSLFTQLSKDSWNVGKYGYLANHLENDTLNAGGTTASFSVQDRSKLLVLYEDTLIASTGEIELQVSTDDINFYPLKTLLPVSDGSKRKGCISVDNLGGVNFIRFKNTHGSDNYTAVYITNTTSN